MHKNDTDNHTINSVFILRVSSFIWVTELLPMIVIVNVLSVAQENLTTKRFAVDFFILLDLDKYYRIIPCGHDPVIRVLLTKIQ